MYWQIHIFLINFYLLQLNTEKYRSGHNEAVLKTVCLNGRVGSNPTFSAKRRQVSTCRLLLFTSSLFTIPWMQKVYLHKTYLLRQTGNTPAGGWCVFSFAAKKEEMRTGRLSAESKKAAGGRLFSPRVESYLLSIFKTRHCKPLFFYANLFV